MSNEPRVRLIQFKTGKNELTFINPAHVKSVTVDTNSAFKYPFISFSGGEKIQVFEHVDTVLRQLKNDDLTG